VSLEAGMSEIQKAAVRRFTDGRVFSAIQSVYEAMPARFTTREMMFKSGLKGAGSMYAAISVLERAFHCHRTAAGIWRKPDAA
jgi:hypothetical protein